ncbi:ribosome assembly, variant 2 [Balamuthia mandrillaris]
MSQAPHYSWSELNSPTISTTGRPKASSPATYPYNNANNHSNNTTHQQRRRSLGQYCRRKEGKGLFVLADELFLYIFSFMDPIELSIGSCVCKEFRRLITDESLWKSLYMTYWKRDNVCRQDWKAAVKRGVLAEARWETGLCSTFKLQEHTDSVNCVYVEGSMALSGGADAVLHLWDAHNGAHCLALRGHTAEIRAMQVRWQRIVSASADSTLKIWRTDSAECIATLVGHRHAVECLSMNERNVVSGANDLRLWDLEERQCVHVWNGHTEPITKVHVSQGTKTILSASMDGFVKAWDARSPDKGFASSNLFAFKHPRPVTCLQTKDYMVVTSAGNAVYCHDTRMGRCAKLQHPSPVICLAYYDYDRLVSGSRDSTVRSMMMFLTMGYQ